MSNSTRNFFFVAIVLATAIFTLMMSWALIRTAGQRSAANALNRIGIDAINRSGMMECSPGYSFDERGPHLIEDLTGPLYFGNVTGVSFRACDDKQLLDSIPHLQRLAHLSRVWIYTPPNRAVVKKLRESLPNVTFVDRDGNQIP